MPEKGKGREDLYVYSLGRSKTATNIAVSSGDLQILKMYSHIFKRPMVWILHDMIGTAAKCWEENHVRRIRQLEEKSRTDERIIQEYIKRFGHIRPRSV